MLAIAAIVAPVFGLILLGWLAQRTGYMSDGAGRVLSEFAFKVAMPALLFRAMLNVGTIPGSPTLFLFAYFAASALTWLAATVVCHLVLRRPREDGAAVAMGACFGNTVMLGIPLGISAFGPEAAAPMALLVSIETPLLWVIATLHMEVFGRRDGAASLAAFSRIVLDLLRNPIVMALVLGSLGRAMGVTLPPVPDKVVALLGQAAVPSALFALGMSLATYEIKGQMPTLTAICFMKLALFPALTYLLAVHVFQLPPLLASIAILLAAMPVGANAYLFAARYERAVGSVSSAIAVSTTLAVATVSLVLFVLAGGGAR